MFLIVFLSLGLVTFLHVYAQASTLSLPKMLLHDIFHILFIWHNIHTGCMSESKTLACRRHGRPKKQSPSWRLAAGVGNVRSLGGLNTDGFGQLVVQLVASERPDFLKHTKRMQ